MQLLRFSDVPMSSGDRVFRYSRLRAAAAVVAITSGSAGLILLGYQLRSGLAYYIAAVLFAGLLVLQTFVRARFRPTNWLMRANDAGLFIQFRSYLNYRFPQEHQTVALLHYGEIGSARVIRERQLIPDRDVSTPRTDAVTEQRRSVVEIELKGDLQSLTRAIDDELVRCFGSGRRHDAASTRYRHAPVRMTSPTTLLLEWKVTPGPGVLCAILRAHGVATDVGENSVDYRQIATLSRADQERRLLELTETGATIAAVDLARRLYGYDLTRAKAFVEELRRPR
jgi:hypothetical protein